MNNEINIKPYVPEDRQKALELLNRNFHDQQHLNVNRDIEWWEWKYENNIFGHSIIYVAEANNKLAAIRPFWRWQLSIIGKKLNCYQPIDSAVDLDYRRRGLFSKLTEIALLENKNDIDIIFNFPNEQSLKADLKLGWAYLGKLKWFIKINNIFNLYSMQNTNLESCKLSQEELISIEKINLLKHDVDFNFMLKTINSKEFLTWRYLNHPKVFYGMGIVEEKRKLLAYIYEINEKDQFKELILIDYFGDLELFEVMLKEISSIVKKHKVTLTLIINKSNVSERLLLKNSYFSLKRKNFVVLPLNLQLGTIAKEYSNWDISLGMHDSV